LTNITPKPNDIPFETSFRLVSAQLLEYWHNQESLPPSFYSCPTWCSQRKEKRSDYCRLCPVSRAENEFRAETIALLDKRIGDEWKQYDFDSLLKTVYEVSGIFEKDDSDWTIQTVCLVQIFKSEEAKRT
jgi:hypothetical protein